MKSVTGAMGIAGRSSNRWSVLPVAIAALVLISCATSDEPPSGPAAAGLATETPSSTGSGGGWPKDRKT